MVSIDPRHRRLPTPEERDLWRQATRDAVRLPLRRYHHALEGPAGRAVEPPAPPPPDPSAPVKAAPGLPPEPAPVRAARPALPLLDPGAAPGVDRRTGLRLRRGQLPIEARLDLHGLTQDQAHRRLTAFIRASIDSGRRCVLVITGKGSTGQGGVLRQSVPRWLNEPALRPLVVAIQQAQPRDGGEGALYVLLKRLRTP